VPCTIELSGPGGSIATYDVDGPRMLMMPVGLSAGENRLVLRVTAHGPERPTTAPGLLLQSLSVERIPNPKY